jgi:hypothetical protein
MSDYIFYVLAFVAGVLVKAVDWIDDEKDKKNKIKYLLAILYGLLIGYLISAAPFSTLFLAALVAQAVARKIDTAAHMIGFSSALLSLFLFGFPSIEMIHFALFFVLAFIDELKFPQPYEWLTEWRVFLKLGAAVFIIAARVDYLISIMAFDIGYILFSSFAQKRFL